MLISEICSRVLQRGVERKDRFSEFSQIGGEVTGGRKEGRKSRLMRGEREREGEEFRWKLGGTEREKAASHLDRRSAGLGERKREREARRGVLIHQLRVLPPSTPALCPSCRPPLADSLAPFHFASLPSLFPSFVPPQRRERSIRDRHRPPAPTSQLPSSSFPP